MKNPIKFIVVLLSIVVFSSCSTFKEKLSREKQTLQEELQEDSVYKVEKGSKSTEPLKTPNTAEVVDFVDSPLPKINNEKTKVSETKKATNVDLNNKVITDTLIPFKNGERQVLNVSYFGATAGTLELRTFTNKSVNGKPVYHFTSTAKTSRVFSTMYYVKDVLESYVSQKSLKPYFMAFHGNESGKIKEQRLDFNWKNKTASMKKRTVKKDGKINKKDNKWTTHQNAIDINSAFYLIRSFPLKVGRQFKLYIAEDGKNIEVKIRVVKTELLKTNRGKIMTFVLKPDFTVNGEFKKMGDISFWISADENRYIEKIAAKIKLGTIVARLKKVK